MADYIDKNILCQAYIHVHVDEGLGRKNIAELEKELLAFTTARARFFVYPEVDVNVEFRDGSLKAYLTIAGGICLAISNYGGLRSGIDILHSDIKRLADSLVNESLFVTKTRRHQIVRTEARTGVIGSLKVLVDDMKTVEDSLGQISVDEAARRVKRLREDAELLIENVKDEKDRDAVEADVELFTDGLPAKCPHPPEKVPDDAAIFAYQDALSELRKRFGKQKGRR